MESRSRDIICSVSGIFFDDNADFDELSEICDEFIANIPELADRISNGLFSENIEQYTGNLKAVTSLLRGVRARRLECDAEYLLRLIGSGGVGACRRELSPFITELLTLSIDMQTAKSRAALGKEQRLGELEITADIAASMTTVERLLTDGDCLAAFELVLSMRGLRDNPAAAGILEAAACRKRGRTCELAKELKDHCTKLVASSYCNNGGAPRMILAVDDRPEILNTVSQALKQHCKVLGATGGCLALKVLERNKPELFILDIEMPEMNGLQLANRIRLMEAHAQTPIIFLTSNATKEYVRKAMAEGADDFIIKPANNLTLLAKVSKYLS